MYQESHLLLFYKLNLKIQIRIITLTCFQKKKAFSTSNLIINIFFSSKQLKHAIDSTCIAVFNNEVSRKVCYLLHSNKLHIYILKLFQMSSSLFPHTFTTWYCAAVSGTLFSDVMAPCRTLHVAVLADCVAPTIITEWRDVFVSYSWITLVMEWSLTIRLCSFISAMIAFFNCSDNKIITQH